MADKIRHSKASDATLCYECQNAVPNKTRGCEWSRELRPVPGWTATPTIKNGDKNPTHSFFVHKCPKYDPDPPRPWAPDVGLDRLPITPRPKEECCV